MITVSLAGADKVAARWTSFEQRMREELEQAMMRLGDDLATRISDKLGGGVLQRRSGRLAAAQQAVLSSQGGAMSIGVGFDPQQVPYGAIQEYGGTTRAHLIEAKRGSALAFSVGGRLVLAKRVQHPGSVIPERSFLRSALAEMADEGSAEMASSVRGAVDA